MRGVTQGRRTRRRPLSAQVVAPVVIIALSVLGLFLTKHLVDADRSSAASRQAEADATKVSQLLQQVTAFDAALAEALQSQSAPDEHRFAALEGSAGSANATLSLTHAMWVEQVSADEREAYERRIGRPITRFPGLRPAGVAPMYLPATFIVGLPLPPGVDVSGLPGLAATLRDPTSIFVGTATTVVTLAGQRGFFTVQGGHFGRGPGSTGFLVVFVPGGFVDSSLGTDADRVAIKLGGRQFAGTFTGRPSAGATFNALTRTWRIDVAPKPKTALQSALPPLVAGWPLVTALVVFLVGRGMLRRRRAEREIDDIYDLSPDLLCILDVDGYLKRVNPAFERVLGYPTAELLSRPLVSFVHPDDRARAQQMIDTLPEAGGPTKFDIRYVGPDGETRWLEWSARPMVESGLIYGAARDVTDSRRLLQELTDSRRRIVSTADETRRRVGRDLHDGSQQRLVQTILLLKRARSAVEARSENATYLIDAAVGSAQSANEELRELARGIHPPALRSGGLPQAVRQLARRSPIPVALEVQLQGRLPEMIEVTAYYFVSEALTNAAKHSKAQEIHVTISASDHVLTISVSDDGIGGADRMNGTGLIGLEDRVAAAGGTMSVHSPPGGGTRIQVTLPVSMR